MSNKGGRPPYEPTEKDREQVRILAAMGVTLPDIATVIGISEPTLRKYFEQEIRLGRIRANAQVAQSLFRSATDKNKPSVVAQIFWLKCQAGWREAQDGDQPPALGKKGQAQADSRTAADGTEWDELLPRSGATLQ